jgi:hypothetical protein
MSRKRTQPLSMKPTRLPEDQLATSTETKLVRPSTPPESPRVSASRVQSFIRAYKDLRILPQHERLILHLAQDLEDARALAARRQVFVDLLDQMLVRLMSNCRCGNPAGGAGHIADCDVPAAITLRMELGIGLSEEVRTPAHVSVPRYFYRSQGVLDEWCYLGTRDEARWSLANYLEGDLGELEPGHANGETVEISRLDLTQEEVDAMPEL